MPKRARSAGPIEVLPQFPCKIDHPKGPKTWNSLIVLSLEHGFSPEPHPGPSSQHILPQAEFRQASRRRWGSDHCSRLSTVAYCPACRHASRSLHSRYARTLHDLPWQGSMVELRVDVRRFRCRSRNCPRVTFAETLPLVSPRYGRQTSRLSETVRLIGYVLGGEAGARLSQRLGMATSPDTVLRRLKGGPSLPVQGARAVGVDDWAWRKGQRYGTILVNLETHVPMDLLPDRSADSLAAWLQSHPGAEVISRDRAGLYAEGATRGAPQAVQVADRFHLLCNLTSAVQRVLEQKRTALAKAIVPVIVAVIPELSVPHAKSASQLTTRSEQVREDRRQCRMDRYNEVVGLLPHRHEPARNKRQVAYGAKDNSSLPARRAVPGTGDTPPRGARRR